MRFVFFFWEGLRALHIIRSRGETQTHTQRRFAAAWNMIFFWIVNTFHRIFLQSLFLYAVCALFVSVSLFFWIDVCCFVSPKLVDFTRFKKKKTKSRMNWTINCTIFLVTTLYSSFDQFCWACEFHYVLYCINVYAGKTIKWFNHNELYWVTLLSLASFRPKWRLTEFEDLRNHDKFNNGRSLKKTILSNSMETIRNKCIQPRFNLIRNIVTEIKLNQETTREYFFILMKLLR